MAKRPQHRARMNEGHASVWTAELPGGTASLSQALVRAGGWQLTWNGKASGGRGLFHTIFSAPPARVQQVLFSAPNLSTAQAIVPHLLPLLQATDQAREAAGWESWLGRAGEWTHPSWW